MECPFCNSILSTKFALKRHMASDTECLKEQHRNPKDVCSQCLGCEKFFTRPDNFAVHQRKCKAFQRVQELNERMIELTAEIDRLKAKVKLQENNYIESKVSTKKKVGSVGKPKQLLGAAAKKKATGSRPTHRYQCTECDVVHTCSSQHRPQFTIQDGTSTCDACDDRHRCS